MNNKYKKQVFMGTIGDMKNLEQHYSDMAKMGWMIDKIGLNTHRYHAIPPCKKRFFVDFLPQITAFDYPENEDAKNYRCICEESGWNFIAANKQFHVFCTDGDNDTPIPIHTDNSIHAKIYLKASRKYELPWLLFILLLFWFSSPLNKGIELILSDLSLFMAIGHLFFLIGYIWTVAFVIRWYIRIKKAAKYDLPLPIVNRRFAELRNKAFSAGTIAFLACMIIGVVLEVIGGMSVVFMLIMFMPLSASGVGLWIRHQIDTNRRTRAGNIKLFIITIIIMEIVILGIMSFAIKNIPFKSSSDSLDNRPVLTLNDVGAKTSSDYPIVHVEGSVFVPMVYAYWESNSEGSVHTKVYRSVNKTLTDWLYDHCVEEFTKDLSGLSSRIPEGVIALIPDEAAFWGALRGVTFYHADSDTVRLLLLNNKTILRIAAEGVNMNIDMVRQAVQRLWDDVAK